MKAQTPFAARFRRLMIAIAAASFCFTGTVSADHTGGRLFDIHDVIDSSSGATMETSHTHEDHETEALSALDDAMYYGRKMTVLMTVLYLRLFLP